MSKNIFFTKFSELSGNRYDPKYNHYIAQYQTVLNKSVKFGSLLLENPKYGANESSVSYNHKCRYIRITDIDEFGLLKQTGLKSAENEEEKYKLKINDILFARSGATVGKTYIHKDNKLNAIFAGYMIRFKINENKINPNYIFYYTQLNIYKQWINAIQRSAGQPNINAEEYQDLDIPIPSDNIQNKIIEKMDTAYRLKEQKEKEAKKKLESIDTYLLDELGIELPSDEKESLEDRVFLRKFSNISGERLDPFYIKNNKNKLNNNQYKEVSVKSIASIKKGQSIIKDNIIHGNYQVIAGGQTSPYSINRYNENENVITISASGAYAGYVWYHSSKIFASDCSVVRSIDENIITTLYLFEILKAKQNYIYNLQQGAGQPHIYGRDIEPIKIPLPPLEIQNKIANHIQQLRDEAKALKDEAVKIYEDTKKEVEKMILGDK